MRHVVATAGHVDHGKSALVRALTGIEPDRWAEERRRGLTIDLGFAWTTLPSSEVVAFVDVPGHERFVTNMLAGVGPVPAVLLVVAADEGWMPQTAEHVRVLDALGVEHGLLVVTKSDLADPQPVVDDACERLAETGLRGVDAVAVSAATGEGLDELRAGLARMVRSLPTPDHDAPVRLWVDRSFTIAGAGTVVTGTLAAGTVRVGDRLAVAGSETTVVVRGVQSRGEEHEVMTPTARVALNLRGVERHQVPRGSALVAPDSWLCVDQVDVLADGSVGRDVVVHLGSAAVPARVRRLGQTGLRVQLRHALPLHYGDRLLLREPSSRAVVGATVADLAPRPLQRRGDADAVGLALHVPASAGDEVLRRGVVDARWLTASGLRDEPDVVRIDARWVDRARWEAWRTGLAELAGSAPDADGIAVDVVRERLGVPDAALVAALVAADPGLEIRAGLVRRRDADPDLAGIAALLERLAVAPLDAPDGDELRGLDRAALARGVRAGRLLHLGKGIYVRADAGDRAVERLSGLSQPFAVADATRALGSTRRVVVPLLEHLDSARRTRRLPDGTRFLVGGPG